MRRYTIVKTQETIIVKKVIKINGIVAKIILSKK